MVEIFVCLDCGSIEISATEISGGDVDPFTGEIDYDDVSREIYYFCRKCNSRNIRWIEVSREIAEKIRIGEIDTIPMKIIKEYEEKMDKLFPLFK